MKAVALMVLGFAAAGPVAPRALAQPARSWLHVRVDERETQVRVNLPLNVVEVALRAAPEVLACRGRIHVGRKGNGLSVSELRALWRELKATGDVELVSVEETDEYVKVERKADLVQVRIDKAGKEQVRIELPVSVLDALFTGEGEVLDVPAALRELQKRRGDIVRVTEADSTVRVWIDESHTGESR